MPSVIKSITPRSPADVSVIKAGQRLIALNGHVIKDIMDYKFYSYDSRVLIETQSGDGRLHLALVRKEEGEDLGLEFETYLMDKARACKNKCIFCFIDQMPRGMRKTLYFKDDDARLSFLLGNYITLTNLSDEDVDRIIKMHISPVNISVHTTNPALRRFMLGNENAGSCMDTMKRLADAGITMNCQIVCCPGINDGEELLRSMRDLKSLAPAVHSVSIVPVGITKCREGLHELKPFDRRLAEETIDLVESVAEACFKELGTRVFFCSDELYITARRPIPPEGYYEDYAQIENGVGMLRSTMTEFTDELSKLDRASGAPFSIATGLMAEPFIKELVDMARNKCDNISCNVFGIRNDFFGELITVSGLVTGGDLIAQLKGRELGEYLLIPESMLRREERDFLDDITLRDAENALGVPIYTTSADGAELARAVFGILPETNYGGKTDAGDEFYRYNPPMGEGVRALKGLKRDV
ncbi:MAG: DUF512 domain-containing protein [Oscillospiraceae bacterium]|nr:DUF512 domain-containing protein [Oscillospiraceae bacterium]